MNDVTQARSTLSRLKEEILIKTQELQSVSSQVDELKAKDGSLTQQIIDSQAVISQLERDKQDSKTEIDGLYDRYIALTNQCTSLQQIITAGKSSLDLHKKLLSKLYKDIQTSLDKLDKITTQLDVKQQVAHTTQKQLDELEREKQLKDADLKKQREALQEILDHKSEVDDSITSALERFAIFEGRIQQLSQQTGFLIKYSNPNEK